MQEKIPLDECLWAPQLSKRLGTLTSSLHLDHIEKSILSPNAQRRVEGAPVTLLHPVWKEREREIEIPSHSEAINKVPLNSTRWRKFTNKNLTKLISNIYYFLKGKDRKIKAYGLSLKAIKDSVKSVAIPQVHVQVCVLRTDVQHENPQTLQDFQSSNIQLCSLCSIY